MAIVCCRECRKTISTEATTCPHCGCPSPAPAKTERPGTKSAAILITIAIAATIGILANAGFFKQSHPPPPLAPIAQPIKAPEPPLHPDVIKAREAVDNIKDDAFCGALGKVMRNTKNPNLDYQAAMIRRAENREGVSPDVLLGIRNRRPMLGMNACAVIAALGRPDRANRSVRSGGEHYQLVYSDRGMYVYLDNNIVTSWQD